MNDDHSISNQKKKSQRKKAAATSSKSVQVESEGSSKNECPFNDDDEFQSHNLPSNVAKFLFRREHGEEISSSTSFTKVYILHIFLVIHFLILNIS